MKHATRTRKARPRSSLAAFGPGVQAAFPSERNTSHFLIVLAVGLGGAALAGEAYAGCNGNATQTIGQVDYGYTWSACWGDSGVDDKDEKNGDPGASITINTQASYTAGASLPYTMPWDSVGGVIMTYTMGGAGVDEGTAGAGGRRDDHQLRPHNPDHLDGSRLDRQLDFGNELRRLGGRG